MTAGTGPTHPANPRPTSPPPPPRPTLATGPITQPPGEPPTIPPKTMHRHPFGRACADGRVLLEIPVALARGVLAELTRRSLAAGAR